MEVFSLEEDNYDNVIVTQGSPTDGISCCGQNSGTLGNPFDFNSPCVSVV